MRTSKKITRYLVQFFVWILIIAFVTTIGASFDMAPTPVIVSGKNIEIDLAPNSLFHYERDRIAKQIRENQYFQINERAEQKRIDEETFESLKIAAAHQAFFKDIGVKPSKSTERIFLANGMSKNIIDLEYGRQLTLASEVAGLSIIATPTIADAYLVQDLSNFTLTTEVAELNKTNFLASVASNEELDKYFIDSLELWYLTTTIDEFIFKNKGEARKFMREFQEVAYEATNMTNFISYKADVIIDSSQSQVFNAIAKAFRNQRDKEFAVSEPTYNKGEYKVAVLKTPFSFQSLDPNRQISIARGYATDNFKELSKKHKKIWDEAVVRFTAFAKEEESLNSVNSVLLGTMYATTTPYTLLSDNVYTEQGSIVQAPLSSDPNLVKAVIDTPNNTKSSVIYSVNSKDRLFIVAPIAKNYQKSEEVNPTLNTTAENSLLQFKIKYYQNMFGEQLLKRYNVKLFPEVLVSN